MTTITDSKFDKNRHVNPEWFATQDFLYPFIESVAVIIVQPSDLDYTSLLRF